jgi:TRL-like protein family
VKRLIVAALALCTSGCLYTSSLALYNDATYARSFQSLTEPDNKPGVVAHGEACSNNILLLVNLGNAGYDAAYQAAMASVGANSLYDVRVDTHVTSVFIFYSQVCTEVTGKYVNK